MTDAARRTVAIRHVAFEDPGLLAPLPTGRGRRRLATRLDRAGL